MTPPTSARQRVRKALVILAFLTFPITMNFFHRMSSSTPR